MEYVRDAINLCVEDEVKFIEKYIVTECKWLIKGLKEICNVEKPSNLFLKKFEEEKRSNGLQRKKTIRIS